MLTINNACCSNPIICYLIFDFTAKTIKFQGQASSLYGNNKNIGVDLAEIKQINSSAKSAKAFLGVFAALIVSGCVSQQSALDFNGQQAVQPVPTGVSLAGTEVATLSDSSVSTPSSNIPVKAPRPTANIAPQTAAIETVQATPTVATTSVTEPVAASTLAIAETPAPKTPTANVIAEATSTPSVSVPTTKPATNTAQTQNTVEVASLSPTVEAAPKVQVPEATTTKKKTFFEKLFTTKEKTPRPAAGVNSPKVEKPARASSRISTASAVAERPSRSFKKPKVTKVKRPNKLVANVRPSSNRNRSALPGVKSNSEIFGIKEGGSNSSNRTNTTQVAALGSLGRLSPNGLRVQHSKVQVACLKPGVLRILKMVERRYGKKPIITSGYRSPKGNRRAGGARNSQHIFCKAVDIQVEGVSKWKLAKYLRTVPGRGGVGTYCRTKSVHIDIGSVRDWHHPCRKSSKRKRKKA